MPSQPLPAGARRPVLTRVFLVTLAGAGVIGEELQVLLGGAPWNWESVLVRGAVWATGLTALAVWALRWLPRAAVARAGVRGSAVRRVAGALSAVAALGLVAVAVRDPRPATLWAAAGVFAAAGYACSRSHATEAGPRERSGLRAAADHREVRLSPGRGAHPATGRRGGCVSAPGSGRRGRRHGARWSTAGRS